MNDSVSVSSYVDSGLWPQLRRLWRVARIVLYLLWGFVLAFFLGAFWSPYRPVVLAAKQRWCRHFLRILGVELTVTGTPVDAPVFLGLLIGHVGLLTPYAVRVVYSSLANLRVDIEEAAITLGATRLQTFRLVVLPNIRGAVIAAFFLAFVTSFNQVPVSLFLTGPGISTLPIEMLGHMENSFDPSIAALSTLLVLFTMAFVLVTEKVLGISKYM